MAKSRNPELEKVLKLIVDSAEKQLSELPPKQAAAARRKIHRIATETAKLSAKAAKSLGPLPASAPQSRKKVS